MKKIRVQSRKSRHKKDAYTHAKITKKMESLHPKWLKTVKPPQREASRYARTTCT